MRSTQRAVLTLGIAGALSLMSVIPEAAAGAAVPRPADEFAATGELPTAIESPAFAIEREESTVTATDDVGDLTAPNLVLPFPDSQRGVIAAGKSASIAVPHWILLNRTAANLFAWAYTTAGTSADNKFAPPVSDPVRVRAWSSSRATQMTAPSDPALRGELDLLSATRGAVQANGRAKAAWKVRVPITDTSSADRRYGIFDVLDDDSILQGTVLFPYRGGWRWYSFIGAPGAYPGWEVFPLQDLKLARLITESSGVVKFRVETAANIPAIPPPSAGRPQFSFFLDYGRDGASDIAVSFRYDSVNQKWSAWLRKESADGRFFQDFKEYPAKRLGNALTVSIPAADLGHTGPLAWYVVSSALVGTGTDLFGSNLDFVPNTGFVSQD